MSRDTQSPGSILVHKFMNMDMNASKLARLAGLSIDTVHRIMCGVQPVTDEIASKLAVVLGTTQEFWTNIQTRLGHTQAQRYVPVVSTHVENCTTGQ